MNSQVEVINRSFLDRQAALVTLPEQESGVSFTEQVFKSKPIPLSFAQQRLWFLGQIHPDTSTHNVARAIRLRGALNLEILQRVLDELVRRHELLRTSFAVVEIYAGVDGQPRQIIHESAPVALSVVDLTRLSEDEREAESLRVVKADASRPFALSQPPLFKVRLLRLGAEEHLLVLTLHHLICDAWSLGVFFRELRALYEAFVGARAAPLAPLPLQYADYAIWQRQQWQGARLRGHLDYWKRQLRGAPARLALPADRPRPPALTFRGGSESLILSRRLTEQLKQLSQSQGASLFMVLLTAFKVLLHRYSRQEDIVVGMPIAGRRLAEMEGLIGPFANTLVLRTELAGEPSFVELLARVKEVVLGALAHQEVPFEKLVEELRPERDLSFNPLFQLSIQLKEKNEVIRELPGLGVSDFEFDRGTAELDLALEITETGDGLNCLLKYSMDLFDEAAIKRLLGHYATLLESFASDPRQPASSPPLLTDAERRQLILWNDTGRTVPPLLTHQLFELQARRTPEAVALSCHSQHLTYAELDRRANQLARHLRHLGATADSLVGLCLERGPDLVVALLATLKAGAAYLPMDPAYPPPRLAYMREDAAVKALLTHEHLLGRVPGQGAEVVCLDRDWPAIAAHSRQPLHTQASPDNLAYVIYTSGSTGRPKGVAVAHRALVNFLHSMRRQPGLGPSDVLLAVTTLSFDIAGLEIYLPLTVGARLVLAGRGVAGDAAALMRQMEQEAVTAMQATPSTWRMLVEAGWRGNASLKVLCGGEALSPELAGRLAARSAEVWNLYGPTETTIWSTAYKVEGSDGPIQIGRPITNTQVYIADEHLNPVPAGVTGELYIGGDGLARGYLNRPEQTAERFLPNPFSEEPGKRLYRTGDLARYGADGNIEHLGRLDQQVKVRGFRIELAEIEAVLAEHPGVREGVVEVQEYTDDDKRLVAYIVMGSEGAPSPAELRRYLRERLPEYMVPAAFVTLEALPLTPNRKVDRRSLPAVEEGRVELSDFVGPRDLLEAQLVKLMEKVLGVQPVGIRDNFFDLGGHSLLAVRLFAQIENRLGLTLPLSTLFQASTAEQLACLIRQDMPSPSASSLVAIRPTGSKPPLFCVHAAGANVLIYRPLARHLDSEQPVYALQAQGLQGGREPYTCVEDMAIHYMNEIRSIQPVGPYYLLGASFGGLVAFEMARQFYARGERVAFLALFDTDCPVRSLPRRIRCHLNNLAKHGLKEYVARGVKVLKDRGGRRISKVAASIYTAPERHSEDSRRAFEEDPLERTVKANLVAQNNYRPAQKNYPDKITFFMAEDCGSREPFEDNRLGWGKIAGGGFDVHVVPGNHLTMREEPHVAVLAEKLADCLNRAQALHSAGESLIHFGRFSHEPRSHPKTSKSPI